MILFMIHMEYVNLTAEYNSFVPLTNQGQDKMTKKFQIYFHDEK